MIKKIGVVGAGMMGAEIALCFARAGIETILCDTCLEFAQKGKEKQAQILDKNVKKGNMEATDREKILSHVIPTGSLQDMAECEFIVEAVLENLELKQDIFRQLDKICLETSILASNTSSISITKLAAAVGESRKSRFIGTHFNSPASVMKLVEVIPGLLTDEETQAITIELLGRIEKEPVKVKDVTGFGLNRLFHCFYLEACRLIEEGVCTPEDVDKICRYGLGHPMGICGLLDITGHDLNQSVDQILFEAYGDRFRPSPVIQRMVDAGRLGRKTGAGFYKYDKK